ncbi:endo-1,4-beta-xylanase [Nocardiopsis sp. CNT312]|uniref:endo-1,4-beta-xylanase n=1 Tax=Nocardiopsis sp. CNT312 TaxID=1137268 RepID=UPI0004AD903D|nr:endo-1,4-beta-xylanase [Nocardiopsis sp. CNT312]
MSHRALRGRSPASAGAVALVVLCGAVALVVTAALVLAVPGQEHTEGDLPELASARGVDLGVAVAVAPLREDAAYREVVTGNYTSVSAENTMKWDSVQPRRGAFDWGGPDTVVDFAESNGLRMRGHTLLWHNQQPQWLSEGAYGADELREIVRSHTDALVGRYEGRIGAWDVINEPMADEGGAIRDNLWYRVLGENYIAEALWMAHEADPRARLYVNEFGIEGGGTKADAFYTLIADLMERGVPLHGIGFQSHFIVGQVPEDLAENMRRYTDLGLEVAVTELDVRIPEPVTDARLQEQARDYRRVVEACLEVEGCQGVTVWGVDDGHSWIPDWFPGYTAATPFDADYDAKPARAAMVEALARRARQGGAIRGAAAV